MNATLATLDQRGNSLRRAHAVQTPCLRTYLARIERGYMLLRSPCDCGTAAPRPARAADLARYRSKGWPEAWIVRAIADKYHERPPRLHPTVDAALWIKLMSVLDEGLGLSRLGLMHHFVDRDAGPASFAVVHCDGGTDADSTDTLAHMADGVVYDLYFAVRR